MNDRYFACTDCKVFTDAGYRWCYWRLEDPGVVARRRPVDVEGVLVGEEMGPRIEHGFTGE